MKTYTFPIGRLTEENRIVALSRVKELYPDATSDFITPYRISATVRDCNDEGDAEFWFGLELGRVIERLLISQESKGE